MHLPKVTFGLIVLNGEPFIRYNLRALYPFAHQIIVVEGASPGAAQAASASGHSTDGTQVELREFKAQEDPEHKMIIVTAEDEGHADGFWPGEKHEQSQAYAERATGDYLWQVDIDEFYKPEDMHTVLEMLGDDDSITALSFNQTTFWGGFDYVADSWSLRRGWAAKGIHRVFKWGPGYQLYHASPCYCTQRSRRRLAPPALGGWKQIGPQGNIYVPLRARLSEAGYREVQVLQTSRLEQA